MAKAPSKSVLAYGAALAAAVALGGVICLWYFGGFQINRPPPTTPTPTAPAAEAKEVGKLPPDAWDQSGTQWRLHVTQYSSDIPDEFSTPVARERAKDTHVELELDVDVLVLPPRHQADRKIGRLQFAANAPHDAPQSPYFEDMWRTKWILEVDRSSGQLESLKAQAGNSPASGMPAVLDFKGVKHLMTQLYGFPVDWITCAADLASVPAARKEQSAASPEVTYTRAFEPASVTTRSGEQLPALKAIFVYYRGESIAYKLEQIWVPGEPWWRSFKRWRGGERRMDLEAIRVEDR